MDKIKGLLVEKYSDILGGEPIPEEWEPRIRRMLSSICKGQFNKDQIVDSKDTSILSNGSEGMVFTTEGLCVKDSGNSTSRFIAPFRDIKFCSMDEDSIFGVDISAIKLHMISGSVYRLSTCLEGFDLEQMKELIEYAISLYQHCDTEAHDPSSADDNTQDVDDVEELVPSDILHIANVIVSKTLSALKGKVSGS